MSTTTIARRTGKPMSDKQAGFILTLLDERQIPAGFAQMPTIQRFVLSDEVTSTEASDLISGLLALPKQAVAETADTLSAGMYRKADGTLIRVYVGQRSGRMLAKKVVKTSETWTNSEGREVFDYDFEYLGLASRFTNPTERLSLEEAAAWGRMTSSCCMCGLRLDDPDSVKAGIGPICATKF